MIRKILIALAVVLPMLASSQTIHWLTFIDTADPSVGALDINGRQILYNRFINVVNAAVREKGYAVNIQDIYGSELSPQKCKDIVTNLNVSPDDIVVFYYIGHGTHNGPKGEGKWPLMLMGQNYIDYFIPLEWVHTHLKSKGPRLTATIGMCCNNYQGVPHKETPEFSANYGNTYLSDQEKLSIQKMFLENKGDFLITSASPGQSSIGGNTGDTAFGAMDYFTYVMVKCFDEMSYSGELDWEELFGTVKYVIDKETNGKQTPIYVSNLSKVAAAPTPAPASVPKTVTAPTVADNSASRDFLNQIGDVLDNLIDTRQTETARIKQATVFEKVFTPTAVVKVLSQDGNVVIDKSSAEDFIGRLATSRILLKVAPVSVTTSGNKISELKVKEAYKK